MNGRSSTDHKAALIALAESYLQALRDASTAARERVFAGVPPPFLQEPQTVEDQAPAAPSRSSDDPVFATREFDLPPLVLEALSENEPLAT